MIPAVMPRPGCPVEYGVIFAFGQCLPGTTWDKIASVNLSFFIRKLKIINSSTTSKPSSKFFIWVDTYFSNNWKLLLATVQMRKLKHREVVWLPQVQW